MKEVLAIAGLVSGVGLVMAWLLQQARVRRIARERLEEPMVPGADEGSQEPPPVVRPFARRHWLLPWLAAALVLAALYYVVGIPLLFAAAFSVLVGLLGGQVDAVVLARKYDRIEAQLADAIDLMVAAVKAGATLQNGLESAAHDARPPLRPQLEELAGRIRYGDDPLEALDGLARRVPLETFRLFAVTLAVNWDVGGSLSQTLATVGRTIRDRIELTRRLRSLTMQARASVVSILLVTYFIAALMWRNNPERMAGFLSSFVGQAAAAFAVVMQGVGIVWIAAISRPRF